jgi:hypothetical protein
MRSLRSATENGSSFSHMRIIPKAMQTYQFLKQKSAKSAKESEEFAKLREFEKQLTKIRVLENMNMPSEQ